MFCSEICDKGAGFWAPFTRMKKSLLLQKIECQPFEHLNLKSSLEGGAIVPFELPLKQEHLLVIWNLGKTWGYELRGMNAILSSNSKTKCED